MGPENSTIHSCASSELRDASPPSLELNLPEGDGFRSLPPLLSLVELIRRSQQLRQWFPSGLPTEEERWQAKGGTVFRL
jgi:hypothetical protein